MMLPILISVSLAPGSYFFCALAAVTVIAAAVANTAMAIRLLMRAGIASLPLWRFFCRKCRKSGVHWQASLIPLDETAFSQLPGDDQFQWCTTRSRQTVWNRQKFAAGRDIQESQRQAFA